MTGNVGAQWSVTVYLTASKLRSFSRPAPPDYPPPGELEFPKKVRGVRTIFACLPHSVCDVANEFTNTPILVVDSAPTCDSLSVVEAGIAAALCGMASSESDLGEPNKNKRKRRPNNVRAGKLSLVVLVCYLLFPHFLLEIDSFYLSCNFLQILFVHTQACLLIAMVWKFVLCPTSERPVNELENQGIFSSSKS